MRDHHILYTILFRPLPAKINQSNQGQLYRALKRVGKEAKSKYLGKSLAGIKEWR